MNEIINFGDGKTVKVILQKGEAGNDIQSIDKTGTSGLVDTYTITLTDGTTHTFTVTNGSSIQSIAKTGTTGLVDTYTVTLTNGSTTTFTVTNGRSITNIELTSTSGLVDTYTITYNDNTTSTFTVTNGGGNVDNAFKVMGYNGAKNLLQPLPNMEGYSGNGITITNNKDGTFTIDGTATANTEYAIRPRTATAMQYLPIGRFIYSVGLNVTTYVATTYNTAYNRISNVGTENCSFEITASTPSDYRKSDGSVACAIYITIPSGSTFNNATLKPMIRYNDDTDTTYQPYAMTNKELTPLVQNVATEHLARVTSSTLESAIAEWCDNVKGNSNKYNVRGQVYKQNTDINHYIYASVVETSGYASFIAFKYNGTQVLSGYRSSNSDAVLTELAPKSALDSYVKTVEISVTPSNTHSIKSCFEAAINYFHDNYYEYGKVFYVIVNTLPQGDNWYPLIYMQIHCTRNDLQRDVINGSGFALNGYCYGLKSVIYDNNYINAVFLNGQELEE